MSSLPWLDWLNAVRGYVETHRGRFPPTHGGAADEATVELGRWWQSQRIHLGLGYLSQGRATAVRDTTALAKQCRRAAGDVARRGPQQQAAMLAAARKAIRRAKASLDSPYLVPGDAEVLRLRIDHPDASNPDLATLAGMTPAAFTAKFRGALNRTAASHPVRRS